MCVAVPMEIIEISEDKKSAKAVLSGNELDINISMLDAKVGDYVLIHAGVAIEKVNKNEADEIIGIFEALQEQELFENGS